MKLAFLLIGVGATLNGCFLIWRGGAAMRRPERFRGRADRAARLCGSVMLLLGLILLVDALVLVK
ncbi:MAG: hypothetical protein ACJ735_02555 [Actinomycetes bacterium]